VSQSKYPLQPESRAVAQMSDYEAAPARGRYPGDWEAEFEADSEGALHGLAEYWRLLLRHRGALLLAAVLGGVAGILLSLPQTPVYRASTRIEVQALNRNFLGMQNVSPTESLNLWTEMATQVELLKSRTLIEEVVKELRLASTESLVSDNPGRLAAWRSALGLPEPSVEERLSEAVAMARGSINVSLQGESRLVIVSTDSTDPNLAARFANTLARAFIRNNVNSRWSATQYTEEWLEKQLEELRIKLEESEDRLQSYARASGLLITAESDNIAEEQLGRLQEQLSTARADRIAKQSQYELVESNPGTALELIENPYRAELAQLRQDLASLSSTFTDDYPEVRSLRARIEELEQASTRAQSEVLNNLRAEYDAAVRRERLLEADYREQANLVSDLAGRSIQYNILKREVDTNRELYDNLLQKGKEARLSSAMQVSPIRVVDEARPPGAPYKPDHFKSSLLGMGVGTLLGVAFIFVRDRLDRTLKRPGDVEYFLNVPELGVIPAAEPAGRSSGAAGRRLKVRVRRQHQPKLLEAGLGGSTRSQVSLSQPRNDSFNRPLFDLSDKTSHIAESFRATVTSLLFSANASNPRCIVISSSFPEEGKSTVVGNLASALSAINRSVLIIDGDMRRPRQHKMFGKPNTVGLTDLLLEPDPLTLNGSASHAGVIATETPGLHLLPSGRNSAAPSNILHSPRTKELFDWARSTYDYVLVDTPPLMQLPDARLFARHADGVVLVVRAGQTNRDAASAAVDRLRKDQTNVLGVVLNGWNPKTSDSYYGSNSYYKYYDSYFSEKGDDDS